MSREHSAYRREPRERASLSAPSLKPFLFFGEAGPRLRFCEQEAFQLGRRRFLGKLHTPCGLLVGFLGAHARSPVLHSLRVPAGRDISEASLLALWRRRQFVPTTRSRYPHTREVWRCSGRSIFLVFGKAGVTSHLAIVSRPSAAAT